MMKAFATGSTLSGGLGLQDFMLFSECPNEAGIGLIDLTLDNAPFGFETVQADSGILGCDGPYARAPLYQTAYHEYQRHGMTFSIDKPTLQIADPAQNNIEVNLSIRRQIAAELFLGNLPMGGSILGFANDTFGEQLATGPMQFVPWKRAMEMLKVYLQVLHNPEVKTIWSQGERLRDPLDSALPTINVVQGFVPPPPLGCNTPGVFGLFGPMLYSWFQPVIYSSVWTADTTAEPRKWLLMLANWVDGVEDTGYLTSTPACPDLNGRKDQQFNLNIDPDKYGIPAGTRQITYYTEYGNAGPFPIQVVSGQPILGSFCVPERSMTCIVLQ